MNGEIRNCQKCSQDFEIEKEDLAFYEKIKVPAPTWCVNCRLKRRLIWRNERTLYKRNCDMCGSSVISMYHKDAPYKVYCRDCWWSDKWDAKDFAKDYDFSKPFFEQYDSLLHEVPRVALTATNNINSDFCNFAISNKNTYLSFASHYNEDSGYLTYSNKCRYCFDCLHVQNSDNSIECNYCNKVFKSAYLQYGFDCISCILGYDLHNCTSCFGCVNLRNASYQIFNIQYSKEDYEKELENILKDRSSFDEARKKYEELKKNSILQHSYQKKSESCVGNDIEESKNLKNAFSTKYSEDSKNLFINCIRLKSCMDANNIASDTTELGYEIQGVTNSANIKFSDGSWNDTFVTYASLCFSSNNLFGCVGVRKGEYMILNKSYSKEEYQELVEKIIKQMNDMPFTDSTGRVYRYGEFFPMQLSPFAYNETTSQEYFPLKKDEALKENFNWREGEERKYNATLKISDINKNPSFYSDSILKEVIACEHNGTCADQCTTAFRIIESELKVYKEVGIPLPATCPNCRHIERLESRRIYNLKKQNCGCAGKSSQNKSYQNTAKHVHGENTCPNTFETVFDGKNKNVYCKECYQQEVY